VDESDDLRKILSQNIKKARKTLHITQTKLAEHSGLSVFHIIEIEQCKTWVSDKSLTSIARALNMEAYELLLPEPGQSKGSREQSRTILHKIAQLVNSKNALLKKNTAEAMEDLTLEILRLFE